MRAPVQRQTGVYEYVVRTGSITSYGGMTVLDDTVLVEPRGGMCRYDLNRSTLRSLRYKCEAEVKIEDFILLIDRQDPVNKSAWSGSIMQTVRKQVCDKTGLNATGQVVCLSYRTETEDKLVQTGGVLFVQRSRSTPP